MHCADLEVDDAESWSSVPSPGPLRASVDFAMMRLWRFAPVLYLISVASILTSTLFAMIYFGTRTHLIPMDIVGVSLSMILLVVFGIVYTAQYLDLYSRVQYEAGIEKLTLSACFISYLSR